MHIYKEYRLEPVMESVHIKEGYENVCENCPNWGPACETCDAFVPIEIDKFRLKEVTMCQMTMCGIPVGEPYQIGGE